MDMDACTDITEQRLQRADLCEVFLVEVVDHIEGWLDRYTAKRTFDLLLAQERYRVEGGLYEVGIYYGKFFAILVGAGFRTKSPVLGIDTFEYVRQADFLAGFMARVGPYVLQRSGFLEDVGASVIQTKSTDIGAATIRSRLGGGDARFVSVDGSHEFNDVLWDLDVARTLLAPGGIIAVDDYLHPICLGVTAATDRFLSQCLDLVPFAYVANKLFLCRPAWADRYRSEVEAAIVHDAADPKSRAFTVHVEGGPASRRNIEASYSGYRVLTIPLH